MNTVIAYVPVLHAGYIRFFKKHGGTLYLLHPEVVPSLEYLKRDLRMLSPFDMGRAIRALGIFARVEVLEEASLSEEISDLRGPIILPDEDASYEFVRRYLSDPDDVRFDSTFLRWNLRNVTNAHRVVPDDTVVSTTDLHQSWMQEAYREADLSPDWWRQVGAVAVRDGRILYTTHNEHLPLAYSAYRDGDPRTPFKPGERTDLSLALHAEQGIVARAAREGESLEDAVVFVTTFPCPSCARLLVCAGVKRVYYCEGYSLLDAQDIFLRFGVEVIHVAIPTNNPL